MRHHTTRSRVPTRLVMSNALHHYDHSLWTIYNSTEHIKQWITFVDFARALVGETQKTTGKPMPLTIDGNDHGGVKLWIKHGSTALQTAKEALSGLIARGHVTKWAINNQGVLNIITRKPGEVANVTPTIGAPMDFGVPVGCQIKTPPPTTTTKMPTSDWINKTIDKSVVSVPHIRGDVGAELNYIESEYNTSTSNCCGNELVDEEEEEEEAVGRPRRGGRRGGSRPWRGFNRPRRMVPLGARYGRLLASGLLSPWRYMYPPSPYYYNDPYYQYPRQPPLYVAGEHHSVVGEGFTNDPVSPLIWPDGHSQSVINEQSVTTPQQSKKTPYTGSNEQCDNLSITDKPFRFSGGSACRAGPPPLTTLSPKYNNKDDNENIPELVPVLQTKRIDGDVYGAGGMFASMVITETEKRRGSIGNTFFVLPSDGLASIHFATPESQKALFDGMPNITLHEYFKRTSKKRPELAKYYSSVHSGILPTTITGTLDIIKTLKTLNKLPRLKTFSTVTYDVENISLTWSGEDTTLMITEGSGVEYTTDMRHVKSVTGSDGTTAIVILLTRMVE